MKDVRSVSVAASAGFCFGVKRAVDKVYSLCGNENVYTYGPIIHNDEVVEDLERKGIRPLMSLEEALEAAPGTVVIRSHGIGRSEEEAIRQAGHTIIDMTCPFVKKIHGIVSRYSEDGYDIIIIGSREHPEVKGISGWCQSPPVILETEDEARALPVIPGRKVCIVSQTTSNPDKFKLLVEILSEKRYDINTYDTICNATRERQRETLELARKSDTMIVIGGKHSSNTQKLYDISRSACKNTYYIQTHVDLDMTTVEAIGNVGITAGASTPHNIIQEVYISMAEESFDELLEASFKTPRNGEVVDGTVIGVKEDEIILNIGYKFDGIISRSEYSNQPNLDLTTVVNVGDSMQAKVVKVNERDGQVLLSYRRLAAERGNKKIEEALENKEVLTAKVVKVLDGGLSVLVDETRVFIPASLVSDTYERNLGKYLDQEISFVITEFNPRKRRIIGDRKQIVAAEKAQKKQELFTRIDKGMVVEGKVKNVTDFGAFIDLGGADGLLHISEMSWGRVDNPRKFLKVGEDLKVLIKDIDKETEKIALTLKFPDSDPWMTAGEKYAKGNVVTGKVARMTDFGAFIELEPGIDALLHVSQISKDRVEKPQDVLEIGQEITAVVTDIVEESQKISLSIKALERMNQETDEEAPAEEAQVEEAPAEGAPAEDTSEE
ncbi:MAG: bifunctional 4-hydroxy-3-methylbut-2-enyl diphosphate reductase/30S ribosomal protein S1 [Lachnospiraceae bacterium]|nr:bifunctional 4-hydroxy-3-methylbut-2-enyl diphosphate reductase/30S ribosomal protein S1 [Lachnospiraceae bacterium]